MRVFILMLLTTLGVGIVGATGQESAERLATDVANDLVNHRLAAVTARFTPEMSQGLPLTTLDKVWSGILQQGGPVREVAPAHVVQVTSAGTVVIVPIRFEHAALDIKINVVDGKVAGLFISPSAAPAQTWSAPAYVDPAKFTNVEVTIGGAPTALGGTLSLPKSPAGKVPAAVLVHGSGPNDRDEAIGPNQPFRDIAEGLASRGVAAPRYDKRTKAHPGQLAPTSTVREETMDDAVAAAALLAARAEIDASRIVIVGHSLGGMLAPRIAGRDYGIAGIVIMAGSTRPLPILIAEQAEYIATLNGPADEATRKRIDDVKFEADRAMQAKSSDVGSKFFGIPAPYWADLNTYNPAATAAKLKLPILLMQGGRDYQVTMTDLQGFKIALEGHSNVTVREFPRLNHLFMSGDGKSRPEEYQRPGHVDAAVIETLTEFVSNLLQ